MADAAVNNSKVAKPFFGTIKFQFACWFALTALMTVAFVVVMRTDHEAGRNIPFFATTKTMLLPGATTHGHYQIELACNACHTPMMGVKQDACLDCHQEELKIARDTHPAKKFNGATNADRLKLLDAQKCITCHREHVPERTHPMGLSLPTDYCYHCHKDVMEQRPSHKDFAFNSCATAGCHNYHDNRALYENFLAKHSDEPDMLDTQAVMLRTKAELETKTNGKVPIGDKRKGNEPVEKNPLTLADADAPKSVKTPQAMLDDWATTAHAAAQVNCSQCHVDSVGDIDETDDSEPVWSNQVDHQTCGKCHERELEGFTAGRHGMRLAVQLPPMTPGEARLPMKSSKAHASLNCSSCHSGHRFDTQFAAVDACLSCHNDRHSLAYKESSHFDLWKSEVAGESETGTGVSCATCHMPRMEDDDGEVFVQHNQNDNLRPNEKMIRSVCNHCHGVAFSIDALADEELIRTCFQGTPSVHIQSVDMVKAWFESKAKKRKKRSAKNK